MGVVGPLLGAGWPLLGVGWPLPAAEMALGRALLPLLLLRESGPGPPHPCAPALGLPRSTGSGQAQHHAGLSPSQAGRPCPSSRSRCGCPPARQQSRYLAPGVCGQGERCGQQGPGCARNCRAPGPAALVSGAAVPDSPSFCSRLPQDTVSYVLSIAGRPHTLRLRQQ